MSSRYLSSSLCSRCAWFHLNLHWSRPRAWHRSTVQAACLATACWVSRLVFLGKYTIALFLKMINERNVLELVVLFNLKQSLGDATLFNELRRHTPKALGCFISRTLLKVHKMRVRPPWVHPDDRVKWHPWINLLPKIACLQTHGRHVLSLWIHVVQLFMPTIVLVLARWAIANIRSLSNELRYSCPQNLPGIIHHE